MSTVESWLEGELAGQRGGPLPWVTLSYAQSLDGCLAARRGQPLALSGTQALQLTHRLRAMHDAILVGIGTVLADDPRLNVRQAAGNDPQPVVLDSRLRFPINARLLHGTRQPWIAITAAASQALRQQIESSGGRLLELPPDGVGRVSLPELLYLLKKLGICSVMVEGGAAVITSFLAHQLVDCAVVTISPHFIGGLAVIEGSSETFPQIRLQSPGYEQFGEDLVVWGSLK